MEIVDARRPERLRLELGAGGAGASGRSDPRLLRDVVGFLATPRSCSVVEDLEAALLELWQDVLGGGSPSLRDTEECARFFSGLGFLHKYKVYGVKVALPFGYSLFDLRDGQGFSFQIHETPKLEGFHVLRPKRNALLYVATLDEWEGGDREWAERWCAASPGERPRLGEGRGCLRPRAGDVVAVARTHTVHTVLGCVLEEYASCSVDSVVRLLDQNTRTEPGLPATHPSPARLLSSSPGLPAREMARRGTGWASAPPAEDGRVIETEEVTGRRYLLRPGTPLRLPGSGHVTSVVVVDGELSARFSGLTWCKGPGGVVVTPPGPDLVLSADRPTCVAVHRVSTEMVGYAWS